MLNPLQQNLPDAVVEVHKNTQSLFEENGKHILKVLFMLKASQNSWERKNGFINSNRTHDKVLKLIKRHDAFNWLTAEDTIIRILSGTQKYHQTEP